MSSKMDFKHIKCGPKEVTATQVCVRIKSLKMLSHTLPLQVQFRWGENVTINCAKSKTTVTTLAS